MSNIIQISNVSDLEHSLAGSDKKPVLIFKHSAT
jgi:hypothetical protein